MRNRKLPLPLLLLLLGIGLRLLLAASKIDRIWPDEHYQTLEPAYHLLHGYGVLSWEWLEGYRSWSLPALHVPLLALASALGFPSGIGPSILARAVYGVFDALVWYRIVRRQPAQGSLHSVLLNWVLAWVMLAPATVMWGVTTVQDHLAMLLFWGLLPILHDWTTSSRKWFWSGLLLFGLVIPKPQVGVLAAGTAMGLLWQARRALRLRELALFAGGGAVAAIAAGLLDLFTVGSFGGTIFKQLANGERLSRFYGTSPDWYYFARLPELLGWLGLTGVAVLLLMARRRRPAGPASPVFAALPGMVIFFAVHSLIPHKETRFLLPILPGVLLLPLLLDVRLPRFGPQLARAATRMAVPAAVLAACLSGWIIIKTPTAYSPVEVGRLEDWIRRDWASRSGSPPSRITLCLLGSHWSFLRGSLGLGAPVEYLELDVGKGDFLRCHYALVERTKLQGLLQQGVWGETGEWEGNFTVLKLTPQPVHNPQ